MLAIHDDVLALFRSRLVITSGSVLSSWEQTASMPHVELLATSPEWLLKILGAMQVVAENRRSPSPDNSSQHAILLPPTRMKAEQAASPASRTSAQVAFALATKVLQDRCPD